MLSAHPLLGAYFYPMVLYSVVLYSVVLYSMVCLMFCTCAGSGSLTPTPGETPGTPAQPGGELGPTGHSECMSCDSHVTSVFNALSALAN